MKSSNTSGRFRLGNDACMALRRAFGVGLACLVFWAGGVSVCAAKESDKKTTKKPSPGLGKLSEQITSPEAYMREFAGRLDSSQSRDLLMRNMPQQGWRPSSSQTPDEDTGLPTLDGSSTSGLTPLGAPRPQFSTVPDQTRFGWSPGQSSVDEQLAERRLRMGANSQVWMSPLDRAKQADPLTAARLRQAAQAASQMPAPSATSPQGPTPPSEQQTPQPSLQETPQESQAPGPAPQGWTPPSEQVPQPGSQQTRTPAPTSRQGWTPPSEPAPQLDQQPTTPAQLPTISQGWMTPDKRSSQSSLRGTTLLGNDTSLPTIDSRTWMLPGQNRSTSSLDGAHLVSPGGRSGHKQPWEYAKPIEPRQRPPLQATPPVARQAAPTIQNAYPAQAAPQRWPAQTSPPWQAPQNQMAQTAPAQNPYAAQATPQWPDVANPTAQTTPSRPAVPAQNPYAAQATPQWPDAADQAAPTTPARPATPAQDSYASQDMPPWPTATPPAAASRDSEAAQMAMGELETIYPPGQGPQATTAPTAPTTPAPMASDRQFRQPVLQDMQTPATGAQMAAEPAPAQDALTQNWLSPKNRAAQAGWNEITQPDAPQNTRVTPTTPAAPAGPVARSEVGPRPGGRGARTVVNGSQARHFYEEKEPAWSLGADLDKYRAHAVREGSRESGESLKKALGGIGLAIEDTTNIITLGYASDRAERFRANDGKGLFEDPGRVPQQAGATLGSLGEGLYSVADLVTFNALPDSQKDVYMNNNPIVRPLIFTGRTIGGAWKTTEEIGNALTWGYFDNVTGSIGMCIESLLEALKHTGEAVTNLARIPVRLITGNNEKADEALDWVLLVPLEMASNVVGMKGISNMDDYETAFAEKGVIGSILEFGGSTFIVYRVVDKILDEIDSNGNGGNGGGSSSGGTPDYPTDIVDPPTGPGTVWWFDEGWPSQ